MLWYDIDIDMIFYDMILYDMILYDMIFYDMRDGLTFFFRHTRKSPTIVDKWQICPDNYYLLHCLFIAVFFFFFFFFIFRSKPKRKKKKRVRERVSNEQRNGRGSHHQQLDRRKVCPSLHGAIPRRHHPLLRQNHRQVT